MLNLLVSILFANIDLSLKEIKPNERMITIVRAKVVAVGTQNLVGTCSGTYIIGIFWLVSVSRITFIGKIFFSKVDFIEEALF